MDREPGSKRSCAHHEVQGVEDEAWLRAIEVATLHCVPMAIKTAINLNVIQILDSADAHLPAAEIVARMHLDAPKPSASLLDRILRLLAGHGILSASLQAAPQCDQTTSIQNSNLENPTSSESIDMPLLPTRAYGLNSISRYFVAEGDSSPSLAPLVLMNQDQVFLKAMLYMDEALLDGGEPFTKAHGMNNFLYNQQDARVDKLFNRTMHDHSQLLVSSLVNTYNGFEGLHSLVDVGGGLGVSLGIITSKYPHINGINFDQPHVIAKASPCNGVEHVGGDMFVSIPKAEAIFMKWILHDWDDEHCKKILRNCYQALPRGGKVIVVDVLLPVGVGSKLKSRVGCHLDILMFTYNAGGRERTLQELQALAFSAGFSGVKVICEIQELTVVEMYNS